VAESVGNVSVRVPGLRRRHHRLHPEKPWISAEGRGFDSRQLHCVMSQDIGNGRTHDLWVRPFVISGVVRMVGAVFDREHRLPTLSHSVPASTAAAGFT